MRKLFELLSAKNRISKKKNFMGLPTSATSSAEEGGVYSSPPCLGGMHTAGAGGGSKFLGFRKSLLNALDEFKKNEEGGMFINSCFIHCQTVKETWYGSSCSSKIGNKTIAETVGDWYFNRERGKRVDCPFPCNPSCLNMDFTLPGARF